MKNNLLISTPTESHVPFRGTTVLADDVDMPGTPGDFNPLRMIVDAVPRHLKQLAEEKDRLERRVAEIDAETAVLHQVLAPAQAYYKLKAT